MTIQLTKKEQEEKQKHLDRYGRLRGTIGGNPEDFFDRPYGGKRPKGQSTLEQAQENADLRNIRLDEEFYKNFPHPKLEPSLAAAALAALFVVAEAANQNNRLRLLASTGLAIGRITPVGRLISVALEILGVTYAVNNFFEAGEVVDLPSGGTSAAVCGLNLGGVIYGDPSNCVIPLQPDTNRGVIKEWHNPFAPAGQKYGYSAYYHQNITEDVLPNIDHAEACGKYSWPTGDVSLGDTTEAAYIRPAYRIYSLLALPAPSIARHLQYMPNLAPLVGAPLQHSNLRYREIPKMSQGGLFAYQSGYGADPQPQPQIKPNQTPTLSPPITIDIGANDKPVWAVSPPVHTFRPPKGGEKEKKGAVRVFVAGVLKARNTVSEAEDVLDAIFKGLENKPKGWKKMSNREKMEYLYRNINDLNIGKAVMHLVIDQLIVDKIIGNVHRVNGSVIDGIFGGRAPLGAKAAINRL